MEEQSPEGVLNIAKGSFNTPSKSIEFFQFIRREVTRIKIGDDDFIVSVGQKKADDPERQIVIEALIQIQVIEADIYGKEPEMQFVFVELFRFISLFSAQCEGNRDVKFTIREVKGGGDAI